MRLDFNKKQYDYLVENAGFTDSEIEVLNFKRRGWDHEKIACELYCSTGTVKNRVKSIKEKIINCIKDS